MLRLMVIIIITVLVDQVSKLIVQQAISQGESIPILPPVVYLTHIQNPGAAFGLLAYQTEFFIAVTVVILAAILWVYRRLAGGHMWLQVSLGLVAGGALGNLIDRVRVGKVIDFLDFRVWPVFNFADIAIVVGAALLIWGMWRWNEVNQKWMS